MKILLFILLFINILCPAQSFTKELKISDQIKYETISLHWNIDNVRVVKTNVTISIYEINFHPSHFNNIIEPCKTTNDLIIYNITKDDKLFLGKGSQILYPNPREGFYIMSYRLGNQ